ncbi:hypothetical protein BaRGS_00025267 [Batillaria attramentaria]|uniref:Uncharacterized protein n=1 Tax=Batillaria attramentaria TaxID=370345 RepID=A0ABD0K8T2_9CAEN
MARRYNRKRKQARHKPRQKRFQEGKSKLSRTSKIANAEKIQTSKRIQRTRNLHQQHIRRTEPPGLTPKKTPKHQPRRKDWEALKELRENPDIIIKKADKCSTIVILNRVDDISEAKRQLQKHTLPENTSAKHAHNTH